MILIVVLRKSGSKGTGAVGEGRAGEDQAAQKVRQVPSSRSIISWICAKFRHRGSKPVACNVWLFIQSYSTLHLLQNTFYRSRISCF